MNTKKLIFTSVLCLTLAIQALAGTQSEQSVKSLLPDVFLRRINTIGPGAPIVVFNTLSWTRTDACEVESPFDGESPCIRITDSAGNVYPARALGDRLMFTAKDVPALGYKVFWASKASKPAPTSVKCTLDSVENEYFKVTIDRKRAAITSILDKATGRQLIAQNSKAAVLKMDSAGTIKEVSGDSTSTMMDSGPARGLLVLENSYGAVPFVQEVVLHDRVPRLDIRLTTAWPQNVKGNLSVQFPVSLHKGIATLGGVERIEDGVAVPSFKWLDVNSTDYGLCFASDAAYDCSYSNACISATLMKKAMSNVAGGAYEVNYSLFTHKADSASSEIFKRSMEVMQPMVARRQLKHQGDLPAAGSLLDFPDGGVVASITGSDVYGRSPMLCFFETNGKATSIAANTALSGLQLLEANANGRPKEDAKSVSGKINVDLSPSSTASYLLVWDK